MKKKRWIYLLCAGIALLTLPVGCSNHHLTLEVALYPYVSDIAKFQTVVSEAWEKEHPEVKLHFADWDCYESDPDPSLDVFVFDSIYLSSFVEEGLLTPIPEEKIQDKEDILPFALDDCISKGELYALPQMLCTDLLYTRKSDSDLSGVSDIEALYGILGDRKTQSVIPDEGEGLLIDLSGTILTKTVLYLDALMDEQQEYTNYAELPSESNLSAVTLKRLHTLWKMGGNEQVSYLPEDNDSFIRARWFAEGKGRAFIGYPETMNAMGDYADDVIVRCFSYGPEKNIPLFYTDMVGIRSGIENEKKELAFELANILISGDVFTRISLPADEGGSPQYLLTSRRSVYDRLSAEYPIYGRLKEIVDSEDNHVFRIGAKAREFITAMEEALAPFCGVSAQ